MEFSPTSLSLRIVPVLDKSNCTVEEQHCKYNMVAIQQQQFYEMAIHRPISVKACTVRTIHMQLEHTKQRVTASP
jgi:hypothetical protein